MKKMFRIAPDFVAFLDYKAGFMFPFDYIKLDNMDALEAMDECEYLFNDNTYMIVLLKRTNEMHEGGLIYRGCLVTRDGRTWHKNDREHGEIEWIVRYNENGDYDVID